MISSTKLENMIKGWFVGSFKPSAFHTDACEVAVKKYKVGDCESAHYHKVATEVTLILDGTVRMVKKEWTSGDIVVLSPGEITEFEALTNCSTIVIKIPGALNDKYIVDKDL